MAETRTETDSFGPLEVAADRYWGAQTQRSIQNFPIGWEKQPVAIVRALGVIKQAAADVNMATRRASTRSSATRSPPPPPRSPPASSTTTSRSSSGRPARAPSRT